MKKKLFICVLVCLALLSGICGFASADNTAAHIGDGAGLLSVDEYTGLEAKCAQLAEKYACGVYIVTVQDYAAYGRSVEAAAEAVYKGTGMGVGEDKDGILLLLSMADRDYDILAFGAFGNYAFTDYGKELLADSFLANFRNNDWAGGFDAYISSCAYMLDCARSGEPVDVPQQQRKASLTERLPFIVLIPCAVSGLFCISAKSRMKTARRRVDAAEYISGRGVVLDVREDVFTHRTQSVQHIERSRSSGGGGGGGTTINSGGFSHKSGKF